MCPIVTTGPDSMVVQKPAGIDLCKELGLGDELLPMNDCHPYILYEGQLQPFPRGLTLIAPTDPDLFRQSSDLFSPEECERILAEKDIPPGEDTASESLGAFIERRFGRAYLDRLAGQYTS